MRLDLGSGMGWASGRIGGIRLQGGLLRGWAGGGWTWTEQLGWHSRGLRGNLEMLIGVEWVTSSIESANFQNEV